MVSLMKRQEYDSIFSISQLVFDEYISKRDRIFIWKIISYKDTEKLSNMTKFMLAKAASIMKQKRYKIDKSKYQIDIQSYNLSLKKYNTKFDWHEDGIEINLDKLSVYTLIIYLRKDITIKNGNFNVILNHTKNKIYIESDIMILLDGDITHKPDDIEGFGCRDSIVIQYAKNI